MSHDLSHRIDESGDQVRSALLDHEYLAPDAAAVYSGASDRAQAFRRRRRISQVAGCAVLGAGLVAGGFVVPGLLPGGSSVVVQDPAGTTAIAAAAPAMPSEADLQKAYNAYFGAGYGYDDALRLAKIWDVRSEPATIKAEAGQALLDGRTLPIEPGPETTVAEDGDTKAVDAFFEAGYDYKDAEKLATLWKTTDTYHAKIDAGKKLLAGRELPFAP